MATRRYQILCQKCTEIKNKKAVKFRSKENGRDKNDHEPQTEVMKQRKRSKTIWRKCSSSKQNAARSSSKPGLHQIRSKRLRGDSPYESKCEADNYGSAAGREVTARSGILKRRASSAENVACCRVSNLDVSPFDLQSCRIDEEEEDIKSEKNEANSIPSQRMFEEKRPKRIRFKIPEGTLGYEDAKKAMWRSGEDESARKYVGVKGLTTRYPSVVRCNSLGSPSESIREIMPVLERLKKDDDLIERESDLKRIAGYIREENEKRLREKLAMEDEEAEAGWSEEDSDGKSDMDVSGDEFEVKTKPKCRK